MARYLGLLLMLAACGAPPCRCPGSIVIVGSGPSDPFARCYCVDCACGDEADHAKLGLPTDCEEHVRLRQQLCE